MKPDSNRMKARIARLAFGGILVAYAAALMGCRDSDSPRSASVPARPAAVAVRSPAQVAAELQRLFAARDYARLGELIIPERREATIELLRAVAEVIDANAAVQRAAEAAYGEAVIAWSWDLAAMQDNLGVFSARLKLISQRLKGDEAVVTLQEGEHIPLVHAEFVWRDGQWQHQPELTPRALVPELRELARVLREVGHEIRSGGPIEAYFDAFAERVFPRMARAVTVRDQSSETVLGETEP